MTGCCVGGCQMSYKKRVPGLKFYMFPGRPHEVQLRNRWITAVRTTRKKESNWVPTKRSMVCSEHFINGIRSRNPDHPSSVPSIFPGVSKQMTTKRAINKKLRNFSKLMELRRIEMIKAKEEVSLNSTKRPVHVAVQFTSQAPLPAIGFTFDVNHDSEKDVGTQCFIPYNLAIPKKGETVNNPLYSSEPQIKLTFLPSRC